MINPASQYYRVRLVKMDEFDDFDFDWNREIIYSGHSMKHFQGEPVRLSTFWKVEIISVGDERVIKAFSHIENRSDAESRYKTMQADTQLLSKLEFDAKYLASDVPPLEPERPAR